MDDLIRRREIYDKVCILEKQAIEHLYRTDPESLEWNIWSAILAERAAFKCDVCDCLSIYGYIMVSESLPDFNGEEREDGQL